MKGCLQYLIRLAISIMLVVGLCVAVILLTSCDFGYPGGPRQYMEECQAVCAATNSRFVTSYTCGEHMCSSCTCVTTQGELRQFQGYHFQEIEED